MIPLFLLAILSVPAQDCRACHAIEEGDHAGSIHDRRRIDCVSCHGQDEFDTSRPDPHRRLPSFRGVPKDIAAHCASCHAGVGERFRESRHAGVLKKSCVACHEPHATKKAAWSDISNRCADCHKAGDPCHGVWETLQAGFESVRARLAQLDRALASGREPPGVSLRDARHARDDLADLAGALGEKQHAMNAAALRADFERARLLQDSAERALSAALKAPSRRLFWLGIFLLSLVTAGALASLRAFRSSRAATNRSIRPK